MRLESIVLGGFKSFAERTVVKVLPGITGIVGPNGCGKCLSGDTPIMLADGRVLPIRCLVDRALDEAPLVQTFDDGQAALGCGDDIQVLALDPITLRLEARPVEAFIRHAAPPFLLRVRTRAGREIVSTHYHPFFTLVAGALDVLTAERLAPGVRIAVPRTLPVKPQALRRVRDDILDAFEPEDEVFAPATPALRDWIARVTDRTCGSDRPPEIARDLRVVLRKLVEGHHVRIGLLARLTRCLAVERAPAETLESTKGNSLRIPEEFDGQLARFLGYLVAEGRTTRSHQVWFVNSDPAVTAEFERLAREVFAVEPRSFDDKPRAVDTLIFSSTLCRLLDRAFAFRQDGKSADKTVPPQVWTAGDDVIAEFLSGLFEGDAFIHAAGSPDGKTMPYLEYVTASRRLADGVVTLLLRLGIFALVRAKVRYAANTKARRRRTYYAVYIYGVDQMRRLARHIRFVGAKQTRLDAIAGVEAVGNPNLDVIPSAAALVRAAIQVGGVRVRPLKGAYPRFAAYAEERCEPSRAGLREAVMLIRRHGRTPDAARLLLQRIEALAASDVSWDEIVEVERVIPPEPWVYDLTVADHHNFVAANVVAHNSNISEAVRWALGEQSAKSLRGQRMEDLIFHGSSSRKAVGLAEVELIFANDGALSVPWSEVAVSRRLYRTGESEYLLNKNVCRLRDIVDLFAGTGASPRAYSVMDQDKLNHVLTAKPHERRIFIEEAAGIARYKQQRGETQGKLDAARQNLVRVRDVMDEVKRQLGSLERQARKAQQYKALQNEKRQLALALIAADYASLTAESEGLGAQTRGLRDAEQGLQARLAGVAAREAREGEALQESDHRLSDLRQSAHKIQGELERLLERREQIGVQIRELDTEAARLETEIEATGGRREGIAAERATAGEGLVAAERLVAERRTVAASIEAALHDQRVRLLGERDRLEALRLEQIRLAGQRTDLIREAGELRERHVQLGRRADRLAVEQAEAGAEAARLATQREGLEAVRDRVLAELASLGEERGRLDSRLADAEEQLGAAESRLADARVALAARRSSLEALRELQRGREGYGSGVRAVFREDGSTTVAGVVGTVADLLEVPAGLERAIEAVLGERLQWVVVERFEDARAAVAYLRAHGVGAATFLPLDHIPAPTEPPSDNGLRWAARAVQASSVGLVHHLLGSVAIVDQFEHAEALWRRNGVVATYVTPVGEVLGPTGRVSGGADAPAGDGVHSLLGRKRQLRETEDEVVRLEADVEAGQATVSRLTVEVAAVRAHVAALTQSTQARQTERLASEKDLEQAARDHERVHRFRETVETESRQVKGEMEDTAAVLTQLESRIRAAGESETVSERTMSRLRGTIDAGQERETAFMSELSSCRVELASATERVDALGRELARLDEIETDLDERLTQTRTRQAQTAERSTWLMEERARTDAAAQATAAERDRAEDEARMATERHQALAASLRGLESERRGTEAELSRLISARHALELRATECRVRREEVVQEAGRVHGLGAESLAAAHDPARDLVVTRQRLTELETRLEAVGPVNLVADDEYRELDERVTFLRTQHDDLVSSIKDLEKALRGMTRTAQERFAQAFQEINVRFMQIFERLFEGGRAELRLVEPEEGNDPLETGVDLMAQPRGKRLQSVTLMSGGERALTGLALLFAIFYYRPSPFCVLDEVDAPLDDANIHRFLRVLRELTSQTQFLVITHNRKTMEAADVLYGVTMQEPGLSKLVSVNLIGGQEVKAPTG